MCYASETVLDRLRAQAYSVKSGAAADSSTCLQLRRVLRSSVSMLSIKQGIELMYNFQSRCFDAVLTCKLGHSSIPCCTIPATCQCSYYLH